MTSQASTLMQDTVPADARYTVRETYLNPKSFSFRARQRRFAHIRSMIERIIETKGHCRIADIGGTEYYWEIGRDFIAQSNVEIHLLNLEEVLVEKPQFRSAAADARDLGQFDDNSFDLVHSNSVIEHLGGWDGAASMAEQVRRLAPAYFVQTPNFWFPIEPHFRVPMFQFLPEQIRYRLLLNFALGFGGKRATVDAAMRGVQSAALLDARQMQALFPDAEIKRERFGPLTKSLMAIRG